MREDMHKVLRDGRPHSSYPHIKTRKKLTKDEIEDEMFDSPSHIPRRATYYSIRSLDYRGCSSFNYNVLSNWLHAQIGRLWDDVYSELAKLFRRRGLQGFWANNRHWAFSVEANCYEGVDGRFYGCRWYHEVNGLFVHPETGLLSHQHRSYSPYRPEPATKIALDGKSVEWYARDDRRSTHYLELIEGIWYEVWETERKIWYGDHSFTHVEVKKRQLNTRELYTKGLKNNPPIHRKPEHIRVQEENIKRRKRLGL